MTIGQNIKKYRKEKGLSQDELANKSAISRQLLNAFERGTRNPSAISLKSIADELDINVDDLF